MDKLLTTEEAADYLRYSTHSLLRWRCIGGIGPKYIKMQCRSVRYRQSDLDAWIDKFGTQSYVAETPTRQGLERIRIPRECFEDV